MARPRRIHFEGAYYHVYNRGVEKRPLFLADDDRRTFLHLLAASVSKHALRLFCYCLMGNHYHLFFQTIQNNLDEALRDIQGPYVQFFNTRYTRVGPLFQGRFKSRVVDEEAYALALTRYIHWNPLVAGLVEKLEGYPWSSYPSYCGGLPTWPWLNTEWLLSQLHPDPVLAREYFLRFHRQEPFPTETKILSRMDPFLGMPRSIRAPATSPSPTTCPQEGQAP